MKHKSLQFKIREIAKIGTLKSYSLEEALEYTEKEYREDPLFLINQCTEIKDGYSRGLILCSFTAYPGTVNKVDVSCATQITPSLADFVLNVAYPINF